MKAKLVGIDLAKRVFQVCVIAQNGSVLFKRKFSRAKLIEWLKDLEPTVVAMEACATGHFWGRKLQAIQHPDVATRSTVSGNKPVYGTSAISTCGCLGRQSRKSSRRGALQKRHHQDAVYVSEYRSASAERVWFVEQGPRENLKSTAHETPGLGFQERGSCAEIGQLNTKEQHQKKVQSAVDGGVHTCPSA